MLELLAPAGNLDAVIAAVQNGRTRCIWALATGSTRAGAPIISHRSRLPRPCATATSAAARSTSRSTPLVGDREMDAAAALAQQASDAGADAILVQDLGLARVLRAALPDIPLHASTQMSIHNLAGGRGRGRDGHHPRRARARARSSRSASSRSTRALKPRCSCTGRCASAIPASAIGARSSAAAAATAAPARSRAACSTVWAAAWTSTR